MKFATPPALLMLAAAASACDARPAAQVRLGEPERYLVRYESVVRNEGRAPLRDVVCDALLPFESARQHVRWVRMSPHGWRVGRDAHGETVATSAAVTVEPGGAAVFSWIASVELREERHAPVAAPARGCPPELTRYLADAPRLGLASDAVKEAADEALRRARDATPLARAEAARDVVRERVRFELDGGWDPAPDVLRRGSGSCTESTFAFVATCRRLGLPARWTGGTLLRAGSPGRACDGTFHRIAEVWLPEHGWWPIETEAETQGGAAPGGDAEDGSDAPSPGDDAPDPASRTPLRRSFLLLARGDGTADVPGAGDGPLGASYHSRERWARTADDPAAAVRGVRPRPGVAKRAWWLPGVDDALGRAAGDGLADETLPSFSRAELLACDARGFGPALDADGRPQDVAPTAPAAPAAPAARDAAETAELLLRAGHPEGLRLAAAAFRGDGATLRAVAAAHCSDLLAEEFLAAAAGTPADFEGWWVSAGDRVRPLARGSFTLDAR